MNTLAWIDGSAVVVAARNRWTIAWRCAVAGLWLLGGVPLAAQPTDRPPEPLPERVVVATFEDLLGREPGRRELREWRERSAGMTPEDLERAIRGTREFRRLTPEKIITDAYRELLAREPDADGMRHYRRRVVERGWTAGDVRRAIRGSDEFRIRTADVIIDRAFDDLLERTPSAAERDEYRRRLLKDGTEDGIRRHIKKSEEFRYTLPHRKITRAYQDILGRDPDPGGLENYRRRMVNEGWSIDRVRQALLKSPEYRKLHPKR